ncbi:hypothetical protein [Vulcanisaeta distributa]|uniref:hypothetical protein n=1 Tax=Vulcanisaeta distributa TaxID=164451 RepID=UPI001FB4C25D|nr:hypothetical protein [Vulcanisaeta distributa]
MSVAVLAVILVILMLIYGIPTKTLQLLDLIRIQAEAQQVPQSSMPLCSNGSNSWFANEFNVDMTLRQGNNSITINKGGSIVYMEIPYYSNIKYTFIIHKPKNVFILMFLLGETCSPVIMPNAGGVIEIELRDLTWYIMVNSSGFAEIVYPSCFLQTKTINIRVDSMGCIPVYNLYDDYIYVFVYPPVAQPPGWKPTLNIYLMSNCTFYDLSNCNYLSETVYIYFRESG